MPRHWLGAAVVAAASARRAGTGAGAGRPLGAAESCDLRAEPHGLRPRPGAGGAPLPRRHHRGRARGHRTFPGQSAGARGRGEPAAAGRPGASGVTLRRFAINSTVGLLGCSTPRPIGATRRRCRRILARRWRPTACRTVPISSCRWSALHRARCARPRRRLSGARHISRHGGAQPGAGRHGGERCRARPRAARGGARRQASTSMRRRARPTRNGGRRRSATGRRPTRVTKECSGNSGRPAASHVLCRQAAGSRREP